MKSLGWFAFVALAFFGIVALVTRPSPHVEVTYPRFALVQGPCTRLKMGCVDKRLVKTMGDVLHCPVIAVHCLTQEEP